MENLNSGIKLRNIYTIECFGPDGVLKWREVVKNTTVTVGLNDILTQYFKGAAYTAAWNVGLKGTGTIAAGDTMASHAGWAEVTAYSGNRPTLTLGTASGGSIDNSASKASYTMNGSYTVAGAFVCVGATGTSGILYGAADFAQARSGGTGDTMQVTVTLTAVTA